MAVSRHNVWETLQVGGGGRIGWWVDRVLITLILASAAAITYESLPDSLRWTRQLELFDWLATSVFTVEYLGRIWSCSEDPRYTGLKGRLRFALSPLMLLDLLAILPFYLGIVMDLRMLRLFRLVRLLRLAKAGKYSSGLALIFAVLRRKREELVMSLSIMLAMIFAASCLMYQLESEAQPEHFSSIPAAFWWAVVTLTTIGYGDVYPITTGGKIVTGLFALLAIGMVALPTGIISSGYIEALHDSKSTKTCPHCGKPTQ